MPAEKTLEEHVQGLKSTDPEVKTKSAQAIASSVRKTRAIPNGLQVSHAIGPLVDNLKHEDYSVKANSAWAIAEILEKAEHIPNMDKLLEAVKPLMRNIEIQETRPQSSLALRELYARDLIAPKEWNKLLQHKNDDVKNLAIKRLAEIVSEKIHSIPPEHKIFESIGPIIENLKSDDPNLDIYAGDVIAGIVSKMPIIPPGHKILDAIEVLGSREWLKLEGTVTHPAEYALAEFALHPGLPEDGLDKLRGCNPKVIESVKELIIRRMKERIKIPNEISGHIISDSVSYSEIRGEINRMLEGKGREERIESTNLDDLGAVLIPLAKEDKETLGIEIGKREINIPIISILNIEDMIRRGEEISYHYPIGNLIAGGPGQEGKGVIYLRPGNVKEMIDKPMQEICHQGLLSNAIIVKREEITSEDVFKTMFDIIKTSELEPEEFAKLIAVDGHTQEEVLDERNKRLKYYERNASSLIEQSRKAMKRLSGRRA